MQIKFICPFWGCEHLCVSDFIDLAKNVGYDGIEINVPFDESFQSELKDAAQAKNMVIIGQQWLAPAIENAIEYRQRFEENLYRLASLKPVFISSHTGKDFFSFEENCALIELADAISKETSIPIWHETHRGRFTFHSATLLTYLKQFPDLKLTGDFSHWCTVSESLLEDQESILEKIIPHVQYIHARIGHEQAPQVNDPRAPEWAGHLARFFSWWDRMVTYHLGINTDTLYICTEFGPQPYLPVHPYTQVPVANQWELNVWIKQLLTERYSGCGNALHISTAHSAFH